MTKHKELGQKSSLAYVYIFGAQLMSPDCGPTQEIQKNSLARGEHGDSQGEPSNGVWSAQRGY